MLNQNHPYHLVTLSPWPIMCSMNLFNLLLSLIIWFYMNIEIYMIFNSLNLIISMILWWRDVIRESTYQGNHTYMIMNFLKFSMILFITSELFFFISFFWTFIHSSISPNIEIGQMWPPMNISTFNPYDIPLLNSIILISSGFSITWSHYCIMNNKFKNFKISLILTIMLGIYFSSLQYIEYYEAPFCINDSIYGSIFFMTTGFHGLHVLIGITMLIISYIRSLNKHFSSIHHFQFEATLWYWHFVDVIWLFLYTLIYWWMK
uniref:Cytochrome c oxidase subunit 3 n=1 Tax=Ceratina okinawana TaxID=236018 RepID=A0A7U0M7T5_9HYME|nr:cytochrome c oxidase subunit III [Ceratina okinawana]QQX27991.1 cytochrome c oxidase subunit 3 [Ceratina okinawana]